MATVSEIVDLDSGVASSEATPEGQTAVPPTEEVSINGEEFLQVSKEAAEESEKDKKDGDAADKPADSTDKKSAIATIVTTSADDEDEEEDDVRDYLVKIRFIPPSLFW